MLLFSLLFLSGFLCVHRHFYRNFSFSLDLSHSFHFSASLSAYRSFHSSLFLSLFFKPEREPLPRARAPTSSSGIRETGREAGALKRGR